MDGLVSVRRRSAGLVEVSGELAAQAAAARQEARRLRVQGVRLRREHQRLRWEARRRRRLYRERSASWSTRPTIVSPWSALEWVLLPPDDVRPPLELVR
jgi:hypothetical protein